MSDAALDLHHGEYMRNGNRRRVEELTLQGWSATQIGRALGISPSTVYAHRHAARKRSREPLTTSDVSWRDLAARDQQNHSHHGRAISPLKDEVVWLSTKKEVAHGLGISQHMGYNRPTNQIRKTSEKSTMPRQLSERTLRIIELKNQGQRNIDIAAMLGISAKLVGNAVKTGRRNGPVEQRHPKNLGTTTLLRKFGVRTGSMSEVKAALTADQWVWLATQASDIEAESIAEFIVETVRDMHAEDTAKRERKNAA